MPLYKVNFDNNVAVTANEIAADDYATLKEFGTSDGYTIIKWYIVQAVNEKNAIQIAEKLVYQIWGEVLASRKPVSDE
jgi:hypothetical protein